MGLILTRSPFHISRRGLDSGASMQITIGRYSSSGGMGIVFQTYQLDFRSNNFIDISGLISSEFEESYVLAGSGNYVNQYNNKFQNRPLLVELRFRWLSLQYRPLRF